VSLPLSQLAARAHGARVHGAADTVAEEVCYDSRRVRPGSLFVAIPGLREDGLRYVESALKRGAVAVAAEVPPTLPVPWIQVSNARRALAGFSAALLGDPAERLELVGVTGTNGKTTTAFMIEAALARAGRTPGLVGTVQHRIAGQPRTASHTTPESSDLQALFRAMVDAGCDCAAVEVSSHALQLGRVHGCRFRVAVFTNLSRDHLDLHGDMDSYFRAKRLLFSELLREDGVAVINADDARAAELVAASRGRVLTFSLESDADLTVADLRLGLDSTSCVVRTPLGEHTVETPLIGRFNVRNLLGAFGACLALELDPAVVAAALRRFPGAPGRMERIHAGQDFAVIVDYAHTDEALRNLLETVRELAPARLITVFGCGGDRDKSKRPLMGAVAARLSDTVVLTNDNPRSEPPEAILDEIQRGLNGGRATQRIVIPERRDAIARALEMAGPGDAVVIAGKGHETQQVLRDRSVPFDDRQVVRQLLARLPARTGKA